MIQLPRPPRSYTTRHIRCISCDELFTVSEEFIEQNQPAENGQTNEEPQPAIGQQHRTWRPPPNQLLSVHLRRQDNREERPVSAQSYTVPDPNPVNDPELSPDDTFLNCPRCGADNRNWLQLLTHAMERHPLQEQFNLNRIVLFLLTFFPLFFLFFAINSVVFLTMDQERPWIDFLWPTLIAILLSAVAASFVVFFPRLLNGVEPIMPIAGAVFVALLVALLAFLIVLDQDPDDLFLRALPLAVTTAVVAVVFPQAIVAQWRDVLQARRLRRWLPQIQAVRRFPPHVVTGVILVLTASAAVPLLFYFALPTGVRLIMNVAAVPSPPRDELQNYQEAIIGWRDEQSEEDQEENTYAAAGIVLRALDGYLEVPRAEQTERDNVALLLAIVESQQEALPQALRSENQRIADALTIYVADLGAVTEERELMPNDLPWAFFLFWMVVVGVVSGMTTTAAVTAVNTFVRGVDRQLPPPIYYSVANMTRVVAWEAKRSLEINGAMSHIQWMSVTRNTLGGIDLIGLHRDSPRFDDRGNATSDLIPAQRHWVRTDRWGRIETAAIQDIRTYPTVDAPGFVVPADAPHFIPVND